LAFCFGFFASEPGSRPVIFGSTLGSWAAIMVVCSKQIFDAY
jgi:hypothetical protein